MNIEQSFPKTIKVKRIPKPGFFGITAFKNSMTTLGCPITKEGHKTGLTKEEEAHYEKLLKLQPGTLDKYSEWWDNFFNVFHTINLHNNKTTEFVLDNPINQLKYKIMLVRKDIANSEDEKTPDSEFYIDNAELKAIAESKKLDYEMEGLEAILKMTLDQRKQALRIFGKTGLDDITDLMAKSELGKLLKKDAKSFVETINDKELEMKAFVLELIEKAILMRRGQDIKYEDTFLGTSIDAVAIKLDESKNQELKLHLKSLLNKKKKSK